MTSSLVNTALELIDRGCVIFPVDYPLDEKCQGIPASEHLHCSRDKRGKHNTRKYANGIGLTKDEAQYLVKPMRNYGINTRASGLIVLDEDIVGALKQLANGREIPYTYTVVTHDGRKHYYFKANGLKIGNGRLTTGIDVRADSNGYVVGPGSLHYSGVIYMPEDPSAPFADLAPWMVEDLQNREKNKKGTAVGAEKPTPEQHTAWKQEVIAAFEMKKDVVKDGVSLGKHDGYSEAFYYFVRRFKEMGMSQGNAVFYVESWCKDKDKYWSPYRVDEQVANVWVNAPEYEAPKVKSLILKSAEEYEVDEEPIDWIWERRLPQGELAIVAGDGGVGKSTFVTMLAAKVTRGTLEGDLFGTPRNVLYLAVEDSWTRTLVPRFKAAGADLSRIFNIEVTEREVKNGRKVATKLTFPENLELLEQAIIEAQPAMVVIDPLMSHVDAKLSENANKEIRDALEPLVELSHRYNFTLVGIAHLNKNSKASAGHRIIGSIGIRNLARVVVLAVADEGTNYLGVQKNNLGQEGVALTYDIVQHSYRNAKFNKDIETSYAVITGEDNRTIEEVFAELGTGGSTGGRPAVEKNAAIMWLLGWLRSKENESSRTEIIEAGALAGHAQRTVERALQSKTHFEKAGRSFGASQCYRLTESYRTDTRSRCDTPTYEELLGE